MSVAAEVSSVDRDCAPCLDGVCERHCGGRKRPGPGLCRRPAGWGTSHAGVGRCKLHGGATPSHVNAAKRRSAARSAAVFGLPVEVEPVDALLQEVHRTAGHVAWLGAKIASFANDSDLAPGDEPGVWVRLYQAERAHQVRVAKACVDSGIAERQVRLAEAQGRQLADVLGVVVEGFFALVGPLVADPDALARLRRDEAPAVIRAALAPLATEADYE